MNIVFVTTRLFDVPRSGGEICTARLLGELLDAGHRLHVIGRGPAPPAAAAGALRYTSLGPAVPAFEDLSPPRQLAAMLCAVAAGQASTVHRLAAGGPARLIRQVLMDCGSPTPDALWLDHLQVWPWTAGTAGLPAPVLVMHNLESLGYAEQAAAGSVAVPRHRRWALEREARLLRRLELQAIGSAAAVACLSEHDAAPLRALARASGSRAVVEVLPGFPLRSFAPSAPPSPSSPSAPSAPRAAGAARRIGLIGTWTWAPNRAGLQWLLDRVLPLLPGDCRVVLAGSGLDNLQLPDRVQSLGRVDDIRDFYGQIDVIAVATVQGSGVQEKAIEAIACGLSVVATPLALRGLGGPLPAHVCVAEDPAGFASACAAWPTENAAPHDAVRAWAQHQRDQYRGAVKRCLQAVSNARRQAPAPHAAP